MVAARFYYRVSTNQWLRAKPIDDATPLITALAAVRNDYGWGDDVQAVESDLSIAEILALKTAAEWENIPPQIPIPRVSKPDPDIVAFAAGTVAEKLVILGRRAGII